MKGRNYLKMSILRAVVKSSGLGKTCLTFFLEFLLCAVVIWCFDPSVPTIGDSLWVCFQIITTIGFGDITLNEPISRVVCVVLSLMSIFFIAVLTAAVVNYTQEAMHARRDRSVALLLDKVEHLEDLTREELAEISRKIRKLDADRHR